MFLILTVVRFVATALNACMAVPLSLKTVFSCCPSHFWETLVTSLSYNSVKCVKSAFLESVTVYTMVCQGTLVGRHFIISRCKYIFSFVSLCFSIEVIWRKAVLCLLTRFKYMLFDMRQSNS